MSKYVRTLTIQTDTEISDKEITLFRGAVLASLGEKASLLYHNHISDTTFRYAYPLVQYKRIHGKAAIICIEKAVDLIGQYLTSFNGVLRLGERETECRIENINLNNTLVGISDTPYNYRVCRWLPLNSKNYQTFKHTEGLIERITMCENIFKANLLSMLKGLDIYLDEELKIKINRISNPHIIYNKGIGMTAFDTELMCNLTIPNHIGVGKNASVGCGIVSRITN